ncbi:Transcriptional regulator, IclR family [Sinomonas atrocyanea]|uniref:Glycerol operon regulatory protein n=1 Tax=Sinomonas atrocyanea TaxID=37927 RepID=A0A127A4Y4_9MICC|nr:IclR family transcriptional regulator C-terminal domain-containing protein [Sinomonas atrocyanea]AMM34530.1 Transcriptional regulator, IclR family [Sinomonas atrocyanea]GEB63008.1 IclR family transcriptional regulator [Sinomonas atrocyanea]GGG68039.1 IclR family transcriptional regulator [Sinomonas atrocyanea]
MAELPVVERSDAEPKPGDAFVQSLARGLAVVRAFDAEHQEMTLSEVAARTALTRATARRFLHTLVELGYVRTDGRTFSLTPLVLQLGYAYLSGQRLPELAQPILEELSHRHGESTSLAILDGTDIVYLARIHTRRIISVGISPGTRFPAHATSMGRVLLAALTPAELAAYFARAELAPLTPRTLTSREAIEAEVGRVREAGYAVVDQELEVGLRSLAVPVLGADGRTVAAINMALPARIDGDGRNAGRDAEVARLVPELQAAAASIAEAARAVGAA